MWPVPAPPLPEVTRQARLYPAVLFVRILQFTALVPTVTEPLSGPVSPLSLKPVRESVSPEPAPPPSASQLRPILAPSACMGSAIITTRVYRHAAATAVSTVTLLRFTGVLFVVFI